MKTLVIDPDIKKSGIAQYNSDSGRITYGAEDIGSLLSFCKKENPDIIYVEASWNIAKANLRKTQFNVSYASKQALHAGQNQGFGLAIVQLLKSEGFKVMEVNPIEKCRAAREAGDFRPECQTQRKHHDGIVPKAMQFPFPRYGEDQQVKQ